MLSSCSTPETGRRVKVSLSVVKVTFTPTSLSLVTVATDVKVITVAVTALILYVALFSATLAPVTFTFLPTIHPSVINVPPGEVT